MASLLATLPAWRLIMDDRPDTAITRHFGDLPDPRIDRTRKHDLIDILSITLCAFLCGADTWEDVADFGRAKKPWLATFLRLPNGIPSHDTFDRVFALLDPQAFHDCFVAWVRSLCEDLAGETVHIDGKTLRRSLDRTGLKSALHLVSAFAGEASLSLGQVAVDDKSNEITAIPKLLKILDIRGASITIDAMGCQKEIARQIVEQEGDYVLAVKDNQPMLLAQVKRTMDELADHPRPGATPDSEGFHETIEKGHGRIETRKVWCAPAVDSADLLGPWKGLTHFGMVERRREVAGVASTERAYYITSHATISAQRLARTIRGHWRIENALHWTLDMSFDEDRSRVRVGHGAQNLALIRKIALNLLKNEKTSRRGIQGKRLKAGWDEQYLIKVLKAGI